MAVRHHDRVDPDLPAGKRVAIVGPSGAGKSTIAALPAATDGELADVAAQVRLLSGIDSLPDRFETHVGAHGARMSGGQRQRLAADLDKMDEIMVLRQGRVAERGTHLQLTEAGRLYAAMWQAGQTQRKEP